MLEITTEKFSGPLGLLLSLIEKEEMDITEIALAKIADDYVAYVQSSPAIDVNETADFLLIAAKLLFIKSKALLPYLYSEEEEKEIDDLEKQLKMYKEFVEASQKVKELIARRHFLFLPPLNGGKGRRAQFKLPSFSPPAKLKAQDLADCFRRLAAAAALELRRREKEKLPEKTMEPKVSIEDKIETIKKMLFDKVRVSFSRLLSQASTKTEIIVSFLAVLELAKQKELVFEQDELFSEIHIRRQEEIADELTTNI
jgi:segregation and condensation protein A